MAGDRFVIRRFSPLETLGGGLVLDPEPPKRKKDIDPSHLDILYSGELSERIEIKIKRRGFKGMTISEIEGWVNTDLTEIHSAVEKLLKKQRVIKAENRFFHIDIFNNFKTALINLVKDFHEKNPFKEGLPKEELKAKLSLEKFPEVLMLLPYIEDISVEGNIVKLKLAPKEAIDTVLENKIIEQLKKNEFQPPFKNELAQNLNIPESKLSDILKIIAKSGKIIRINDSLYLVKESYEKMLTLLKDFFAKKSEMTVSEFRTMLNTTRKYALPYLEHLDSSKITIRVGEVRKLVKR